MYRCLRLAHTPQSSARCPRFSDPNQVMELVRKQFETSAWPLNSKGAYLSKRPQFDSRKRISCRGIPHRANRPALPDQSARLKIALPDSPRRQTPVHHHPTRTEPYTRAPDDRRCSLGRPRKNHRDIPPSKVLQTTAQFATPEDSNVVLSTWMLFCFGSATYSIAPEECAGSAWSNGCVSLTMTFCEGVPLWFTTWA